MKIRVKGRIVMGPEVLCFCVVCLSVRVYTGCLLGGFSLVGMYYYRWLSFLLNLVVITVPSVLWRCWLSGRKGIRPVKNWVVGCWRGCLSGARCRLAYGPADAIATHCLLLHKNPDWFLPFWYRLTRVVPEKGPLNGCVCIKPNVTERLKITQMQAYLFAHELTIGWFDCLTNTNNALTKPIKQVVFRQETVNHLCQSNNLQIIN